MTVGPRAWAGPLLLLAIALLTTACSDEPPVEHVWQPYAGDAFPRQTQPFPWPPGAFGLTSDNGSDTLTAVAFTGQVLAQAHIGRNPVDVDGPHHLAVDRPGGFVYVALAYPAPTTGLGPHAAHGLSAQPGYVQKLALADLRLLGEVRVDPNPGDIVLSDDRQRLVVSHYDVAQAAAPGVPLEARRGVLSVIQTADLAPGGPDPRRVVTCLLPHGVALAPGAGDVAYVACQGEDALAVVDLAQKPAKIERIPVGPSAGEPGEPVYGPYSAVRAPDGGRLAIGNVLSKDVRLFDTAQRALLPIVAKTAGAPMFPAWSADGQRLYVPMQTPDGLAEVDTQTGAVLRTLAFAGDVCKWPHEATLAPDGQALIVVCEGDHVGPGRLLALDPATLQTLWSLAVGVYPDRLAIAEAP